MSSSIKLVFLSVMVICSVSFNALAQAPGTDNQKKRAKEDIEGYRRRVVKGENFGSIAALYSEDPGSNKNGGIYKNIVKGMMVKEFDDVAFSLKPGDISEVFETQYGYHFIQLIARRGDEVDLRHILVIPR